MMKYALLIFSSICYVCLAQDYDDAQGPFTRFDTTTVQMDFIPLNLNKTAIAKAVYKVTVDGRPPGGLAVLTPMFSATVNTSSLSPTTSKVYLRLLIGQASSPLFTVDAVDPVNGPPPYIAYNGNIVPILTALVSMTQGVVDTITWDWDDESSRCSGCDPELCVLNYYCSVPKCTDTEPITSSCQLRVYIAWVGTDAAGRYCTSSNSMFSKFTALGVQNLVSQARNGASAIIASAQAQLSNIGR